MRLLRPTSRLALCAALLLTGTSAAMAGTDEKGEQLLQHALQAMGGESMLRSLQSVRIAGASHSNMLEQSERPEGPYIVTYTDFDERRDFAAGQIERTSRSRSIVGPPGGFEFTTIVADGVAVMRFGERTAPGAGDAVVEARESLALGPVRVLLTALAADGLQFDGSRQLQGVAHDVVSFDWNGHRARLYLNHYTALPTAVEWVSDYPFGLWASWGDVTTRVEYSLWHLEPGGLMYPRQWTETRNDLPQRDTTILEFETNPARVGEPFEITAALRAGFEARKAGAADQVPLGVDFRGDTHRAEELAPGILQIQGQWNVALVDLPEGIVVLEAPISPAYSSQVLDEVATHFPERDVAAVISTSDAWPHHAGAREYVARGIPVHAFDLTVPLLRRVTAAPRTFRPDRLSLEPRSPEFVPVAATTAVGTGANRMLVLPIHGEGGERMLAVYFPEHRLLYASDLIQRGFGGEGFFMPSYLVDIEMLVDREDLDVDTVFAMHLGPTPWREITEVLTAIREER